MVIYSRARNINNIYLPSCAFYKFLHKKLPSPEKQTQKYLRIVQILYKTRQSVLKYQDKELTLNPQAS